MDTTDKHPRWAGVLLSLFLPGAGQFFAGAKRRGVIWGVVMFLLPGVVVYLLASPFFSSLAPALAGMGLMTVLWLWMLADAARPMAKLDGLNWLVLMLCGLGAWLLTESFWTKHGASLLAVPNSNMAPALQAAVTSDGRLQRDVVVAQKCAYWFNAPQRGDVVLFKMDNLSDRVAKGAFAFRVAGLPGERISIADGRMLINGQPVSEPAIFTTLRHSNQSEAPFLNTPQASFVVPENHYFVLGDNSAESYDSRFWGPVPRDHILGRVTRICWPLDRAGIVK